MLCKWTKGNETVRIDASNLLQKLDTDILMQNKIETDLYI